jgi:hypothetical protein
VVVGLHPVYLYTSTIHPLSFPSLHHHTTTTPPPQAEHIDRGNSPYLLETYRYTPALALMLTPNVWWFRAFGKLLFVAGTVLVCHVPSNQSPVATNI